MNYSTLKRNYQQLDTPTKLKYLRYGAGIVLIAAGLRYKKARQVGLAFLGLSPLPNGALPKGFMASILGRSSQGTKRTSV